MPSNRTKPMRRRCIKTYTAFVDELASIFDTLPIARLHKAGIEVIKHEDKLTIKYQWMKICWQVLMIQTKEIGQYEDR